MLELVYWIMFIIISIITLFDTLHSFKYLKTNKKYLSDYQLFNEFQWLRRGWGVTILIFLLWTYYLLAYFL